MVLLPFYLLYCPFLYFFCCLNLKVNKDVKKKSQSTVIKSQQENKKMVSH